MILVKKFMLIIFFCSLGQADTFKVLLPELVSYNPITNQINFLNYVGYHLYYPLFRIDNNSQISSDFLDLKNTKAISYDFREYRFCLKNDLKFNDGSFVTSEDMLYSLNQFSNSFPKIIPKSQIHKENDKCIIVKMKHSAKGLFNRLTGISSTILKKSTFNDNIPVGFGPYKILRFDNKILEIESIEKYKYDKINFYSMSANVKKVININEFHDFNTVSTSILYKNANLSEYQAYENSVDKVYSIVLNIKDDKQRACAHLALSKFDWHSIYGLAGASTKNFLPWDIKPNIKHDVDIKCKVGRSFQIIVPEIFDFEKVNSNFKKYSNNSSIDIIRLKNEDFGSLIFSGKPYIALIGFDSATTNSISELNYDVYFDPFFLKKNRLVSVKLNEIEKIIRNKDSRSESTNEFLVNKYSRAESELLNSKYIIPVTRNKKKYYFNKNLKINKWFDRVNGVVDIRYVD